MLAIKKCHQQAYHGKLVTDNLSLAVGQLIQWPFVRSEYWQPIWWLHPFWMWASASLFRHTQTTRKIRVSVFRGPTCVGERCEKTSVASCILLTAYLHHSTDFFRTLSKMMLETEIEIGWIRRVWLAYVRAYLRGTHWLLFSCIFVRPSVHHWDVSPQMIVGRVLPPRHWAPSGVAND